MVEIIAEIGQNHNGDMGLAKELIHIAKDNGADVAKFQVFDARSLFSKDGNPWYDYNCRTELTRDQVNFLAEECRKTGIEFMASVFDIERIRWTEDIGVKRYKVASRSITDIKLLQALAMTSKPLIISLGFWQEKEFPKIAAQQPVSFLYCISKYPTALHEVHLSRVDFKRYAGFSDHTLGVTAPIVAITRGARVIEKHLTLNKAMEGPDHACSMAPDELKTICDFRREFETCL